MSKYKPMVVAAARVLCNRYADECCMDLKDAWNIHSDEFLADAKAALDAAGAPELLEALQKMFQCWCGTEENEAQRAALDLASSAIAKATGSTA